MSQDVVLTPGGYRPKSFVNYVEPGQALILENGIVRKLDLVTKQKTDFPRPPAIELPFGAARPEQPAPPSTRGLSPGPAPALPDGWQTYASWDSGATPITYFSTRWVVPKAPATKSGQIIFIFNGIQNTGSNYGILQPVLQWGVSAAGGGEYWAVANWYVTSGGQAFFTTLVPVGVGANLLGVMKQTSASGGKYSYSSAFDGLMGTLEIQDIAPLHWANETLECYRLETCSYFPKACLTAMTDIDIATASTHPALAWTAVNAITGCGQHTTVVSNANPGGEVDLWYHAWPCWDFSWVLRLAAWAWLLVIGGLIITPGGTWCIKCGPQDPGYIGDPIIYFMGLASIAIGAVGLIEGIRSRSRST